MRVPAQYSFKGLQLAHLVLTYNPEGSSPRLRLHLTFPGTEDCGRIAGRLTSPVFWSCRDMPGWNRSVGLSRSEARIRIPGHVHGTEHPDVHGAYAVIVGTIAAAVADILMMLMVPILLSDAPAFRTPL